MVSVEQTRLWHCVMPALPALRNGNATRCPWWAHPKLSNFHLCAAAVADDETVRTAREVVASDVFSERLFGALRIGALLFDEETVVLEVGGKEVSLACKLAAVWTVEALDHELVHHLRENE